MIFLSASGLVSGAHVEAMGYGAAGDGSHARTKVDAPRRHVGMAERS
jgi:hypothetical protein